MKNVTTLRKTLSLALALLLISSAQLTTAQCSNPTGWVGCASTDFSNYGFSSTNNAATIEYDNIVSSFHNTCMRQADGSFLIWGESTGNSGGSNHLLVPTAIDSINYPNLHTGVPLKYSVGSGGRFLNATVGSGPESILLTTTGLFEWGAIGQVLGISTGFARSFHKITTTDITNANSYGLPSTLTPDSVKMLFATYHTLVITTCSGAVWVCSQDANMLGNGATGSADTWYQVTTTASGNPPLANIVAARGCVSALMALDASGHVWTWGTSTYLGNNTAAATVTRATQMTIPGITVKMIGATFTFGTTPAYYILATNGKLYALGDNTNGELGDWSTTTRTAWVQPRYTSAAGPVMNNIQWISPQEHDFTNSSINVINKTGTLYSFGSDNLSMLGQGGLPIANPAIPSGVSNTDKIQAVETGGHTSIIIRQCNNKFGYVGHNVNGSMADGSPAFPGGQQNIYTFSTATVTTCGVQQTPTFNPANSQLCVSGAQGTALSLSPSGGTLSITSGGATLTGTTINAPTTEGPITVHYDASALGCDAVVDTVFNMSDYGNLTTSTWPVASATVLASANQVWLGNTPATSDCGTNTGDAADGFKITDAISGAGTQASPWVLAGTGSTYHFTVTVNGTTGTAPNPVYWAVWYDRRGNGSFTDASDLFFTGSLAHGSPATTPSQAFTVPTGSGQTSGVIRVAATAVNPTFTQAQNGNVALTNGEIEDFYVSYQTPLPVTLTKFTATLNNCAATLSWQTANELNSKAYQIEQSADGVNYVQAASIASKNDANGSSYSYKVGSLFAGTNYFRLKAVDADGKFTYSSITTVHSTCKGAITITPNPTNDIINIAGLQGKNSIQIFNTVGQKMTEVQSTGFIKQISLAAFAKGTYVLRIINNDGTITNLKVIKE